MRKTKSQTDKIEFLKRELESQRISKLEKSFLSFLLKEKEENNKQEIYFKPDNMITKRIKGEIVSFVVVYIENNKNLYIHFVYTKVSERMKGHAKDLLGRVIKNFSFQSYTATPMPQSIKLVKELEFELTKTDLELWAEKKKPKNKNTIKLITKYNDKNEDLKREIENLSEEEWVVDPYLIERYKNDINTKEINTEEEWKLKREKNVIEIIIKNKQETK